MTETEKNGQEEQPLTPKKKKAMLEYMAVMFAVAFLLVAVSLLVRMHTMKNDFDAANDGAHENILSMEKQLEEARAENSSMQEELDASERTAHALELLALAQKAQADGDRTAFRDSMAELEEYADALPESVAEIYRELQK